MEKNQNDHRNQQSDSKSNQHSTPDATHKKETAPDVTANQGKVQGGQHGNQQHQDLTSGKKTTNVQNTDKREVKEHDQNTKKGNM